MLTKHQRDIIERDYLLISDGQIAISIQATRYQVEHYRRKIGLIRAQTRISLLLENTLLKDEIIDLMCLGWNLADITREIGVKYKLSRSSIGKIINKKIHTGIRRKWERITKNTHAINQ